MAVIAEGNTINQLAASKEGGPVEGAPAYRNPYILGKREKRAKRKELRQTGLRGKQLKQEMRTWKKGERQERSARAEQEIVPEALRGYVNPRKYARKVLEGAEPYQAIKRIGGINAIRSMFGYDQPQTPLQEELLGQQGNDWAVNLRQEERPTYDFYMNYVQNQASPEVDLLHTPEEMLPYIRDYTRERLEAGGLTPEEEAAIRGRERGAVEGGYRAQTRGEGSRLAAMGMDPRSGIAAQRGMQLGRERIGGLTDVERGITLAELARKGELETGARGIAGTEEQARLGDVAANLRRLSDYESLLGTAAPLEEASRRFDVGTEQRERQMGRGMLYDLARLREQQRTWDLEMAEAGRQAALQRAAAERARNAMEPSGWEKAGAVMGGLFGGVGQ